jgi:hypothetical protein
MLSRKLPWSYRHIKAVWYCEERTDVSADEMQQLRRAAKLAREDQEASNEIAELHERLARLESLLLQTDPQFHRETLEAISLVDRGRFRKD